MKQKLFSSGRIIVFISLFLFLPLASAIQIPAHIEVFNKSDNGFEVVDLTAVNTYGQISKLQTGLNSGFTNVRGNITAQYSGVYKVAVGLSIESAGNGEHGVKLFVNNAGIDKCYTHQHITTTQAQSVYLSCLVNISKGDVISIAVDDHSNPVNDVTVNSLNLNIVSVALTPDSNANLQLYGLILIVATILYVLSNMRDDNILRFFSGMIYLVVGIVFINVGFQEFSNIFIRNTVSFMLIGLGSYMVISSGINLIKEGW